jgi:hypothetical protein
MQSKWAGVLPQPHLDLAGGIALWRPAGPSSGSANSSWKLLRVEGTRGDMCPFERWAGVSQGVFKAGRPVGHVPATTGTGGRNWHWHGVRGAAEVPRPLGAALPPRHSGVYSRSAAASRPCALAALVLVGKGYQNNLLSASRNTSEA